MTVVPDGIDTDRQPPMTVPLRHFLVGLGFLLLGGVLGIGTAAGVVPGRATLAHLHAVLVGWVCLTIMGAMTQFVPVWSGVDLHSRRLASAQLVLVTAGLVAFLSALVLDPTWLVLGAAPMLVGVWTFVYNVGRTLARAGRPFDVTERHFAVALGAFVLVSTAGFSLALGYRQPVFTGPVSRVGVVLSHATLAVFGAVLTTVLGALYQLAAMFTQTDRGRYGRAVERVETVAYPLGVLALAGGRLLGSAPLARVGGVLVAASVLAFAAVLARHLATARVEWTPMCSRYAVVAVAMTGWAAATLPAWVADPLAYGHLLGAPGTATLLGVGVVGFVVLGTLYHVVPFIVWVHRYSDRLGYEAVPMIDDLYDDRVAAADFVATTAGGVLLTAGVALDLPAAVTGVAGVVLGVGVLLAAANVVGVVRSHSPHSVPAVILGRVAERFA